MDDVGIMLGQHARGQLLGENLRAGRGHSAVRDPVAGLTNGPARTCASRHRRGANDQGTRRASGRHMERGGCVGGDEGHQGAPVGRGQLAAGLFEVEMELGAATRMPLPAHEEIGTAG